MALQNKISVQSVPQVAVLLQIDNKEIDLSKQGLISMKFDRYLGTPEDKTSNVLSELNMSLFDSSGYDLLGILQKNKGNIYLRYGFKGHQNYKGIALTSDSTASMQSLSQVYKITPTRFKSVYNYRGSTLGIGGYGLQWIPDSKAEYFKKGTPIKEIIEYIAGRNGWLISKNFEVYGRLPNELHKSEDILDYYFISQVLVPIADQVSIFENTKAQRPIKGFKGFYHVSLTDIGGQLQLDIFPRGKNIKVDRRVWNYSYGKDTSSQVISITNEVNYDWIINGITLQIPLFDDDIFSDKFKLEEKYKEDFKKVQTIYKRLFEVNKLNFPEIKEIEYKINFVEPENFEYKPLEELVIDQLRKIVNTLNTIELTVIGNPHINATDLVDLEVVNKAGELTIQSGLWQVIKISESIGITGYHTTLKLVRYNTQIDLEDIKSILG